MSHSMLLKPGDPCDINSMACHSKAIMETCFLPSCLLQLEHSLQIDRH